VGPYQQLVRLLAIILFSALLLGIVFAAIGSSRASMAQVPVLSGTGTVSMRPAASASPGEAGALNPNPPDEVVKLVFIHHSCGNNWLDDGHGNLGAALGGNNYYVSDVYYDWGPDSIGSYTDIGHWWLWFRGPNSSTYLSALYTTTARYANYTRAMADPGGENEIVMFKSCFPNSDLKGQPDDPPTTGDNPLRGRSAASPYHTVGNAKGIYNDILEYLRTRQDRLFIVITAPPVLDATYAANARAFNNWLVDGWLAGYPYHNVVVFDFYNVLTTNGGDADTNDLGWSIGNHHRVVTTTVPVTIEHITDGDDDASPNVLEYPSWGTNNHPSPAGNQKATGEFLPLLNVYYNCWKHGDCWDGSAAWISVAASPGTVGVYAGEAATYTISLTASEGFTAPVTLTLQGAPAGTVTSFIPNPATPPGTSHLTITTTASTVAGIYTVTVTGSSGTSSDTARLFLVVGSLAPSFTLNVSPTIRIAKPDQTVSYAVAVTGTGGFSQPVSLAVVGLPAGVGAAWSANPVVPGSSSTLTFSIPSSPPFGSHPLQVVGTADTQVVSKAITLGITCPYEIYLPIVLK